MSEEAKEKTLDDLPGFTIKDRQKMWAGITKEIKNIDIGLISVFYRYEKTVKGLEELVEELRTDLNGTSDFCQDCQHREAWNLFSITKPQKLFCSCCGKRT